MEIHNFLTDIKYFYWFHKLLFDIFCYMLYLKTTGNSSQLLLKCINTDIKNNGFVIIKLVQWLLCRYSNLLKCSNKDSSIYNFLNNFRDVYEKCNIHSFKYTEKVFLEDFCKNMVDIINIDNEYLIPSASIAQVYKGTLKSTGEEIAIKIRHPDLEYQIIYPYLYYSIYCYVTQNIKYFNKYTIPFDLTSFFYNFTQQIDMTHEAKNLEYFYEEYRDNPLVCIPKPIFWSKNILVMEYIDGEDFDKIDTSKYEQYKFVLLLNLFVRNNLINLDKIHGDLHSNNWKVIRDKKQLKIVIYDFGFCIDIPKKSRNIIQDINKAIETNNHLLFANSIYKYLKRPCTREKFIEHTNLFMELNKDNMNIQNYIEFCIKNNYVFKSHILDLILSSLLVNNYFQYYISTKNIEEDFQKQELNSIKKLEATNDHLITLSTICDSNGCYKDLNLFLKDFIDENIENIIQIKQKNITNNTCNSNSPCKKIKKEFIDI